jgi:hypothetical protein
MRAQSRETNKGSQEDFGHRLEDLNHGYAGPPWLDPSLI